jgi:hypothetical protein
MAKKINPIFEGLPEDKTETAIKKPKTVKRKTAIKKVLEKQEVKPEQINQPKNEFEDITFVSDTTYKLNYIGIRRILMKAGKYIPKLNLWTKFVNWWDKKFNTKDSFVLLHNELDVNTKIEIFESDK